MPPPKLALRFPRLLPILYKLYQHSISGSWVQVDPYHPAVKFLHDVTEPVMAPIRNLMPSTGMLDFSAIVAMVLVQTAGQLTVAVLRMVL